MTAAELRAQLVWMMVHDNTWPNYHFITTWRRWRFAEVTGHPVTTGKVVKRS